jgi:hypothetical protein
VNRPKLKLQSKLSKRRKRSPGDLQSDSKTIRYELVNLIGLASDYSPNWKDSDPIRNNAYVEAFAVHCRALIFFLYAHLDEITSNGLTERFSSVRDNDVLAYDFYPRWDEDCPEPTQVLVESKRLADKHVAHITTDRREVNQNGSAIESIWHLTDVTSIICNAMSCFLKKTSPHCFEAAEWDWMNRRIEEWRYKTTSNELLRPSPTDGPPLALLKHPLRARTDGSNSASLPGIRICGKTE